MKTDKDRNQKSEALRFTVANRWLPQYEVDVRPLSKLTADKSNITDIDVIASAPDYFTGFRDIIFDCKTGAKESAINRSLWLSGLMQKLRATQGFCILKKKHIDLNYRLYAESLNVTILTEDDFSLYASAMSDEASSSTSHAANIDLWEEYFTKTKHSKELENALLFLRSGYWMIDDAATACRLIITQLCQIRGEMNPENKYHVCLLFHFATLLTRSLAKVTNLIFKSYLHPASQKELSTALLHLLYGGKEAYDHKNLLFKKAKETAGRESSDLALPNWESFVDLTRQCLERPRAIQNSPLSLIETGLGIIKGNEDWTFLKTLAYEDSYSSSFAIISFGYLAKAAKLPPEFVQICDSIFLPIQPTT